MSSSNDETLQERLLELLKSHERGISTAALTRAYYGNGFIGQGERDMILTTMKRLLEQGIVMGKKQTYKAKNRYRTGKQRTQRRRQVWVWQFNHQND